MRRTHREAGRLPDRPPYRELLRALGRLLDREGWCDVLVSERAEGFVLHGRHMDELCVLRLSHAEAHALVVDARAQRGVDGPPALRSDGAGRLAAQVGGGRYEGCLRALGWLADRSGLSQLQVYEDGGGLIFEGQRAGGLAVAPARLGPKQLAVLLARLAGMRQVATAGDA